VQWVSIRCARTLEDVDFPFASLRRFPDVEAPNLQAWDATDELLVQRALAAGTPGEQVAVIGDGYGAITLALADAGLRGIRVHQDLATGRRALQRNAAVLSAGPRPAASEVPDERETGRHVEARRADTPSDRPGFGTDGPP